MHNIFAIHVNIVNRHTGGLEIHRVGTSGKIKVNRHTGGLEISAWSTDWYITVNRHTGGLETSVYKGWCMSNC